MAVVGCALAGVLLLAPPALAAGTWTATGSMTTARNGHTATLLSSGRVLVAGGFQPQPPPLSGTLASAELYAPTTATWSATGSMTTAREDHTATLLANGKVLVAGGSTGVNTPSFASAELYDAATGTWSATGSLTTARALHTATLLPNGKVLVVGGLDSGQHPLASAELFDPTAGTWSATGSLSTARVHHTATLLANGKVLVAGGEGQGDIELASAELYDPATGTWSTTGSLNTARDRHTATLLETGKVLVAGGFGSTDILASAELYDPASGTWSATGSMTTARVFHTATLLPNHGGKVLVAGGLGSSDNILASAEAYSPASGTWTTQGSMTTAREGHTATFLDSGQVLVAGGVCCVENGFLASAELFSAPTALELAPSLVANSTGVGPGKALANKATAIQTAVNAGQTRGACGRITGYLALVKAHTGKKLTTDQANNLTTQANDLATELDC